MPKAQKIRLFTASKEAGGVFADGERIQHINYLRVEFSPPDRIFDITILREDDHGEEEILKLHADSVDIRLWE